MTVLTQNIVIDFENGQKVPKNNQLVLQQALFMIYLIKNDKWDFFVVRKVTQPCKLLLNFQTRAFLIHTFTTPYLLQRLFKNLNMK